VVLVCVFAIGPAAQTFAQVATPTPIPGGPQPGIVPTKTAAPPPAATPGEKMMQAYFKAKEALGKKIGQSLVGRPVKSFTYEIVAFNDSELGCAASGVTARPGFVGGYSFVITLFDNTSYEIHTNVDASKIVFCATVGGAATGGGTSPITGKIAGGFEIGGQVQDFSLGTVGKMNTAKMKWVKFQSTVGNAGTIGLINAAKAQGLKALISVIGDKNQAPNAGYWDTYAQYVGSLAAAGASAIEVWNEQNLDREWANGQIDPAKYTGLLAKAATAIKAANSSTIVISGAPAPTGAAGPGGKTDAYWNDDTYYQGMAAAGAANYLDCVGVHYNEGVVSPTQTSGDPRDNYPTRYFQTMLNRALGPFPGKPACFTELGYLTPEGYGPLSAGFAWAQKTTVAQQANWLAQAALAASTSGRVRLMIIFNVDFSYYGADPQAGYAMIRVGGGCPACDALAQIQ
jgi:hypothetical protein